jgi:hypothetical protein
MLHPRLRQVRNYLVALSRPVAFRSLMHAR